MIRLTAFVITAAVSLLVAAINQFLVNIPLNSFLGTFRIPEGAGTTLIAVIIGVLVVYIVALFVVDLIWDTITSEGTVPEPLAQKVSTVLNAPTGWTWWFIVPLVVLLALTFHRAILGDYYPVWWVLTALFVISLPAGVRLPRWRRRTAPPVKRVVAIVRTPETLTEFLDAVRTKPEYRYQGQIAALESKPGRGALPHSGQTSVLSEGSPARYALPLTDGSTPRVYSHQAKIAELLDRPSSMGQRPPAALVTPVSSGRWTIVMSILLDRVLARSRNVIVIAPDPESCRKHHAHLQRLLKQSGWSWSVAIGLMSTPREYDEFAAGLDEGAPLPEVVFVTADVLHERVLLALDRWQPFLSQLDLLVALDAGGWHGLYGANCAYVFRRLFRVCARLECQPQVLAMAEPAADVDSFLSRLFGVPFHDEDIVEIDGGLINNRAVLYWNPPLTTDYPAKRSSRPRDYLAEVQDLVVTLARENRQPLVYAADVPLTSGDLNAVKEQLQTMVTNMQVPLVHDVEALDFPLQQRDTMVLCGSPGSERTLDYHSTHLGTGRSDFGLVCVVPPRQPLAQYLLRRAEDRTMGLGDADDQPLSPPSNVLSLTNQRVIRRHVLDAAAEMFLTDEELARAFGHDGITCAQELIAEGLLTESWGECAVGEELQPVQRLYPAADTARTRPTDDLRTASGDTIALIDANTGDCIGRIEAELLDIVTHERAVLTIGDHRYQVQRHPSDRERRRVELRRQTDWIGSERVRSLRVREATPGSCPARDIRFGQGLAITIHEGQVIVDEEISGVNLYTTVVVNGAEGHIQHQSLAPVEASLPTRALLIGFNEQDKPDVAVLHTLAHACRTFLPLIVICGVNEISVDYDEHCEAAGGAPVLVIYDCVPGGVGACDVVAGKLHTLLDLAYQGMASCPCLPGCDACLLTPMCHHEQPNALLDKQRTLRLLRVVLTPPDAQDFTQDVEDPDVLRAIQRRLVALLRERLSVDIKTPAAIRFFNPEEVASHADGFYIHSPMQISIRHRPYERTVSIVAHESAHNWQFGEGKMSRSLMAPEIPYDGLLFIEGFAEWIEYKALDIYGLFRGMKEIQFIHNDEYGAGFAVLRWLEDHYGVQGVLTFMENGPVDWNLQELYRNAGVTEEMLALWRQRKEAGLPPVVIDWVGFTHDAAAAEESPEPAEVT